MKTTHIALVAVGLLLASAASGVAGGKGGAKKEPSGTTGKTPAPKPIRRSVLGTIDASPSLTKFAAALKAADLRASLKGAGPFTVLAPSDDAVDEIAARWTDLMKPDEQSRLRAILDAHLLPGKLTVADISPAKALTPIAGPAVAVKTGPDGRTVIGGVARIVKGDIECTNGVVHVVDAVMLPAGK